MLVLSLEETGFFPSRHKPRPLFQYKTPAHPDIVLLEQIEPTFLSILLPVSCLSSLIFTASLYCSAVAREHQKTSGMMLCLVVFFGCKRETATTQDNYPVSQGRALEGYPNRPCIYLGSTARETVEIIAKSELIP